TPDDPRPQLVPGRKDDRDVGPLAEPMAGSEKHGTAADDAGWPVHHHRLLLRRWTAGDVCPDRRRSARNGLCTDGFCGAAHADARAANPRALAELHLRRRYHLRLAGACPGRARPARRRFRTSRAVLAADTTG